MLKIVWWISVVGGVLSLILLSVYIALGNIKTIPDILTITSWFLGLSIVPYCLARSVTEIINLKKDKEYDAE